ncbi:MAG: hypothetical protein DCF25_08060 [Leptolyngbya foveolarum]|uniref:Uncharacterized protein n=1 Tax=Leptolyngbya foveolarum TaxID=47253 RepID=A0A2W4UKB1_9CYAN|nr:MAG: hypothetical protein DCF25_08060 [Leptolyngbya foveolarum]
MPFITAGENKQVLLWDLDAVLVEDLLLPSGCEWVDDYLQKRDESSQTFPKLATVKELNFSLQAVFICAYF